LTLVLDNVCTNLLKFISTTPKNYNQLQIDIGAGSTKTVKSHVNHLLKAGLVIVEKEKHGVREYYKITLSEKGVLMKETKKNKK